MMLEDDAIFAVDVAYLAELEGKMKEDDEMMSPSLTPTGFIAVMITASPAPNTLCITAYSILFITLKEKQHPFGYNAS